MALPLTELQKRHLRKTLGVKKRFAIADHAPKPFKAKEYVPNPTIETFAPKRIGRYGAFSGCRMSHEKRLEVLVRASRKLAFMEGLKKSLSA